MEPARAAFEAFLARHPLCGAALPGSLPTRRAGPCPTRPRSRPRWCARWCRPSSGRTACGARPRPGATEFWELGPGGVLAGLARRIEKSWKVRSSRGVRGPRGLSRGRRPTMDAPLTRNFCIIAHVDHGKTTLSDRLLQQTHTVSDRMLHRAAPGLDGPREGARDNDQVAPGDHELRGQGRADLQAQPDGHAGPRRLLLRGLALPGGVRGRRAPGRRVPGRRGPDGGERAPGHGAEAEDHPGHQQDRPAEREPRALPEPARGHPGDPRRGGHPRQRQVGHRDRGDPRGGRGAGAAAALDRLPAGAHARLRLDLRLVPGRHRLRARVLRAACAPAR